MSDIQPEPITDQQVLAKIGLLTIQLEQAQDFAARLQQRVADLEHRLASMHEPVTPEDPADFQ